REYVGIEHIAGRLDRVVAFAAAATLPAHAAANKREEQVLQRVVRLPQLARIDIVNVLPDFRLAHAENPLRREVPVVKLKHLLRQPARNVHAVGDMADWNFLLDAPGPKRGPHATRNVAVKLTHGIRSAGNLQTYHRHRE